MLKEITRQILSKIFNLNHSVARKIFTGTALLFIFMLLSIDASAQIILTDIRDAYTDSVAPTSNFGSGNSLKISQTTVTQGQNTTINYQYSYIEFDKSTLPANLSANDVVKATLKLYVNKVTTAASNGLIVFGTCNNFIENIINWNGAAVSCYAGGSSQPITTANQYVTIDVKPAVTPLLTNQSPFSFLIAVQGTGNIAFDSKESGGNAPLLELELVKINSVMGVGGLTGGGNNGNLLLGIADGGVTTQKLADGAVTTPKIANGAVGNLQLADNSVTSNKITSGAITTNQLSNGSVTDTKLADNSVTNAKLADNSVSTNKINTGAVTTNQLGDSSVTEAKLADNSVTNAKIADGSINGSKIAPNSVGTTQIANGAIGNNQLGANAVTSNKIASGQVVKTVNGLTDNVNLVAGNNITITPSGNTLTISATGASPTPTPTPAYNPQQMALKRWYSVNQSGASVSIGGMPQGLAFDGSNIWVTDAANNRVSKIRASDGTLLGTFQVGPEPRMVEFDGANIWVANFGGNTVTKLRASDGQFLATITVANRPWGLAFDGTNMWVSCYASSLVYKLRASDSAILGTVSAANPLGLAFDGTNIWAVNNLGGGQVTKISGTGTPTVMGVFNTFDGFPFFIAFDGTHIWVVNTANGGSLSKFRISDGANLGLFNLPCRAGSGIAFDGVNLWVTGEFCLVKFRGSDNTVLGNFPIPSLGAGVAFDGANIWVADSNTGTVTKH